MFFFFIFFTLKIAAIVRRSVCCSPNRREDVGTPDKARNGEVSRGLAEIPPAVLVPRDPSASNGPVRRSGEVMENVGHFSCSRE